MDLDILWSAAYVGVLAGLSGFALHRYHLLYLFFRHRDRRPEPQGRFERLPPVTIQLPIYNERRVAVRLLQAVSRLDYPRERMQIQVLDDSTDETRALCDDETARLAAEGFDIAVLRRPVRTGFKAGALKAGMESARGEFVFILDADFVPPAGILQELIHYFIDPEVGMVQARWGHLNRGHSLLTRIQSIVLDGHFLIEQVARSRSGRYFNFNGTAGVWRRSCIEDAGGWEHDTLTEDLDLSYRAQLRGWKFIYAGETVAPAELPPDMASYKSQQHRWAKGATQVMRKILPAVWASALPLRVKLEATFHLSRNFAFPLILLLCVLLYPRDELPVWSWEGSGFLRLAAFLLPFGSMTAFYACAFLVERRAEWMRDLAALPMVLAAGIGLSVGNTRAVFEAMAGRESPFVRTPKYGLVGLDKRKIGGRMAARRPVIQALVEAALAFYFGFLVFAAGRDGNWGSVPFLLMFLAGFAYVSLGTLRQCVPGRQTADAGDATEGVLLPETGSRPFSAQK